MNVLQGLVRKSAMSNQVIGIGATVTGSTVDSMGLGDCEFLMIVDSIVGAATAVKVQDSPDGSTWADMTGAALATLPGDTDDDGFFSIFVSKAGTAHDRYLRLSWEQDSSGSSTATVTSVALFSHANEVPNSATERGLTAEAIA